MCVVSGQTSLATTHHSLTHHSSPLLMSYRAFKHLLGETSLERKCRFLFGAGILLLLTASFWWYADRTEGLAYKQANTIGRLLVNESLKDEYLKRILKAHKQESQLEKVNQLLNENMPKSLPNYYSDIIIPHTPHRLDPEEEQLLKEFQNDPDKNEDSTIRPAKTGEESGSIHYYGAIRAPKDGLTGLPLTDEERQAYSDIKEKDLLAMVKVIVPTKPIEEGVVLNRAVLISTALVTALLIMSGSYLIVRYVIVKPVKHLKEVSDAIAAGELNVRSEIQTGDA